VFDAHAEVASKYYPGVEFRRPPYQVIAGTGGKPPGSFVEKVVARASREAKLMRFRTGLLLWRRGRSPLARFLLTPEERAIVEEFSGADLIVSTGGTYLVENYALGPKLFDLGLAVAVQRPLVLFTQSLGPFRNASYRKALGRIASAASLVLLRDAASRDHVLDLGVDAKKLLVSADAAFAVTKDPLRDAQVQRIRSEPGLHIAISVRAWKWFQQVTAEDGMARFKAALVEVTRRLVEDRGAHVTYVSTCQGVPEYLMDDSKTAVEIVAALPPAIRSRVVVDRAFHTPQALAALLETMDLAVATRMHFAILAMMAGKATVPIAYEFKTTELFAGMKLGHLVEDIETVTAKSLLEKVDWVLDHRGDVETAIGESVARERERARRTAATLRACYAPRRTPFSSKPANDQMTG
jgi:colanic acid/amylovoran biosynthesis protein